MSPIVRSLVLALTLLSCAGAAIAGDATPRTKPAADHPDCAVFEAAFEELSQSGLMGRRASIHDFEIYHFGLTLPYPDKPLQAYLDQYFPDLAAKRGVKLEEATLPAGVDYRDYDRTDESDGYHLSCRWHRRDSRPSGNPPQRVVFFRPATNRDRTTALAMIRIQSVIRHHYGTSTHDTLRAMCWLNRRGRAWSVRRCRQVTNLSDAQVSKAVATAAHDRFDLDCSGIERFRGSGPGADSPWSVRMRLDLTAKLYCADACASAGPIASVTPEAITFLDYEGGALTWRTRLDRKSMTLTDVKTGDILAFDRTAECRRVPFTGLPPAPP